MICSSTETKKIIPKGILNIMVIIIGVISFRLDFLTPTKVKYIVAGISMTILKTIAKTGE